MLIRVKFTKGTTVVEEDIEVEGDLGIAVHIWEGARENLRRNWLEWYWDKKEFKIEYEPIQ